MLKRVSAFLVCVAACGNSYAASDALDYAISQARINCLGISDELNHLKTMAGINTAVTGVGTVAGGVALGTGLAKVGVDKKAEDIEIELERLYALASQQNTSELSDIPMDGAFVELDFDISMVPEGRLTEVTQNDIAVAEAELAKLEAKSKNLGNWRTGTLAVNTATNIAGTIISAGNRVKGDLQLQINECIASIDELSRVRMQVLVDKTADATELEYAERIIQACGEWDMVNISSINSKAKGAAISSGIGIGVGLAGTITSAVANTDATRNDNSESGKQKEQNLNTVSNVLAGGATVASGVSTVFNATQINAIKKAAVVAEQCEEVLK